MRLRTTTFILILLALAYSVLLFFIATYLQIFTKKAAAALTWVVYAQIVKALVVYLAAVFVFLVYIKFSFLRRKLLFLATQAVFSAATVFFISRLGDSVNEYVHYPQYTALVVLWYAALRSRSLHGGSLPRFFHSRVLQGNKPLAAALLVSLILGTMEEGFQHFLPNRVFDFQDILLNFMGVWLGGLIIWLFESNSGKDSLQVCQPGSVK